MKTISFFLPQYHPIPENDEWWGRGFTEWTNVARARPLFRGHYQPHTPGELGFYDLRLKETREAQAALASEHGISGFCYYHYWFNGRELLQRPLDEIVASGKPDFPFCVCWANENWTRSWDGKERQILVAQEYGSYDPYHHMERLSDAFRDSRYITVHGRPLFLVYNADAIPSLRIVVEQWREAAHRLRLPDPYLCGVLSPNNGMETGGFFGAGFDAVTEFHPSGSQRLPGLPGRRLAQSAARLYRRAFGGLGRRFGPLLPSAARPDVSVLSYRALAERAMAAKPADARVFPCVMPSWDNSPRRREGATVIQNDDPSLYGRWLDHALDRVADWPEEEQIVFINAWNEWGEGCHLEPDLKHGRAFLEATRRSIDAARSRQAEPSSLQPADARS